MSNLKMNTSGPVFAVDTVAGSKTGQKSHVTEPRSVTVTGRQRFESIKPAFISCVLRYRRNRLKVIKVCVKK